MRVGVPQILHHRESRPACHPLLPHRQTHLENERLGGAHVPCGAEEQPTHRVHGFQRALQAKKTTGGSSSSCKSHSPSLATRGSSSHLDAGAHSRAEHAAVVPRGRRLLKHGGSSGCGLGGEGLCRCRRRVIVDRHRGPRIRPSALYRNRATGAMATGERRRGSGCAAKNAGDAAKAAPCVFAAAGVLCAAPLKGDVAVPGPRGERGLHVCRRQLQWGRDTQGSVGAKLPLIRAHGGARALLPHTHVCHSGRRTDDAGQGCGCGGSLLARGRRRDAAPSAARGPCTRGVGQEGVAVRAAAAVVDRRAEGDGVQAAQRRVRHAGDLAARRPRDRAEVAADRLAAVQRLRGDALPRPCFRCRCPEGAA